MAETVHLPVLPQVETAEASSSAPRPSPLRCSSTCAYSHVAADLAVQLNAVKESLASATAKCLEQKREICSLKRKLIGRKADRLENDNRLLKQQISRLKTEKLYAEGRAKKTENVLKTVRKQRDRLTNQVNKRSAALDLTQAFRV